MTIQVITLFPEMFTGVLGNSMLWKAQEKGLIKYRLVNLRDFGLGNRKVVDDTPYGVGDGMLLRIEPLKAAIDDAKAHDPEAEVYVMSPRGGDYIQSRAKAFADNQKGLILICGRYEGYDERVNNYVDGFISIGNYVLTGGELAAMVIIDSVTRLIPGVLGGAASAEIESFADDSTREFPQYTRPEEFEGFKVPDILLSGHHAEILKWRDENQIKNTI
jgi:tRNA (guanine37-N1)-methyltransferase